jgi:hypothetical protein
LADSETSALASAVTPPKRGRGRPRKVAPVDPAGRASVADAAVARRLAEAGEASAVSSAVAPEATPAPGNPGTTGPTPPDFPAPLDPAKVKRDFAATLRGVFETVSLFLLPRPVAPEHLARLKEAAEESAEALHERLLGSRIACRVFFWTGLVGDLAGQLFVRPAMTRPRLVREPAPETKAAP